MKSTNKIIMIIFAILTVFISGCISENDNDKIKTGKPGDIILHIEFDNEIQEMNKTTINIEFIVENTLDNVDFVASHGHTVFHNPAQGITLQIGDGKTINEITKLDVICDFRTPDVKLGGQGAPLVPIGDRLLFSDYSYCLNLGGFSNISYEYKGERIAFDICPVNIVLNYYANKAGVPYDKDGNIAQNGKIDIKLLNALNSISYYSAAIPKSLGFEFVEKEILPLIEKRQLPIEDVLRTFIAHICVQISACLDGNEKSKVLITGGGAFNIFLMNELSKFTKNEIVIPSDEIVNYKEALIFALLGVLRSENEVNCLRSVTGASVDHSSGKIFSN